MLLGPLPQLPSHGLLRPPSCLADGDIGVRPGRRGGYQAGCGQCWHEAEGQLSQQLAYLRVEGNGTQCGKGSSDPFLPAFALSFPQLSPDLQGPNQLGGLASWSLQLLQLNPICLLTIHTCPRFLGVSGSPTGGPVSKSWGFLGAALWG